MVAFSAIRLEEDGKSQFWRLHNLWKLVSPPHEDCFMAKMWDLLPASDKQNFFFAFCPSHLQRLIDILDQDEDAIEDFIYLSGEKWGDEGDVLPPGKEIIDDMIDGNFSEFMVAPGLQSMLGEHQIVFTNEARLDGNVCRVN